MWALNLVYLDFGHIAWCVWSHLTVVPQFIIKIYLYFIVYIENARSTSTTTLAFTIASGGTWKIKVSQIECSNLARGVPDCDQYMTGISGAIWSYNWPYIQLRNKDFTFCIRREFGK